MDETVRLTAGDAQADLAPAIGGAVVAFRWRGLDVMRATPPQALAERNVRLCSSFPLVPFSNRIADATLRDGGATHALQRNYPGHPHAIHGVGFQRAWTLEAGADDRAVLTLDYSPQDDAAPGWPYAFRSVQVLALQASAESASLAMTLAIENTGARAFPFGLGWHPYFPRDERTVLGFRADGMWETGPTLLPTRRVPVPEALSFDPARPIGPTTLDNVFTGFDGDVRIDQPKAGIRVTVEADTACGFLVVFIPQGRDVLAVEPVTHMTDAFNRHARGEAGTGTRLLPPAASFSCTMRIVVQPLAAASR